MKVKICGITNLEDALLAEKLGADYLGFIFAKQSPRYIEIDAAKKIVNALTTAKPIGVFVMEPTTNIQTAIDQLKLHAVQLYKRPDDILRHATIYHALRIKDKKDLAVIDRNPDDYYVLDSFHPTKLGGTGHVFDWELLPQDLSHVILAGGINPENVAQACELRPYGIDICSGVEAKPGVKDTNKLKALFSEIQR